MNLHTASIGVAEAFVRKGFQSVSLKGMPVEVEICDVSCASLTCFHPFRDFCEDALKM